jgi:hypothetical protein
MNAIYRSAPFLAAALAILLPSPAPAERTAARPGQGADHAIEPRMSRDIRVLRKRLTPSGAPACAYLYRAAWTDMGGAMLTPEKAAMRAGGVRPAFPATAPDIASRAGARRNAACRNIVVLMSDTHMHEPT